MRQGRRWVLWAGIVVVVAALAVGVGPSRVAGAPPAAGRHGHAQCSLATLNGTYLFDGSGVQVVGNDRVPIAQAGHVTFDGSGGVPDDLFSRSVNGVITLNIASTGTYTVNPNCTGTLTVRGVNNAPDIHVDLFISPDGSKFSFVLADPGFVVSGFDLRATDNGDQS